MDLIMLLLNVFVLLNFLLRVCGNSWQLLLSLRVQWWSIRQSDFISEQIIDISDPKFTISGFFCSVLLWCRIFCVFLHRFSKVEALLSGICNLERWEV